MAKKLILATIGLWGKQERVAWTMRRTSPDAGAGAAAFSAAVLPGGLGVAEVRQIFEQPQPTPLERQFVVKEAPRDGAAVLAMQERHDRAGGSAPHLDIRSINGWNDGYGPMDRHIKPHAALRARLRSWLMPPELPTRETRARTTSSWRRFRPRTIACLLLRLARPRCGA